MKELDNQSISTKRIYKLFQIYDRLCNKSLRSDYESSHKIMAKMQEF